MVPVASCSRKKGTHSPTQQIQWPSERTHSRPFNYFSWPLDHRRLRNCTAETRCKQVRFPHISEAIDTHELSNPNSEVCYSHRRKGICNFCHIFELPDETKMKPNSPAICKATTRFLAPAFVEQKGGKRRCLVASTKGNIGKGWRIRHTRCKKWLF